MKKICSVVLSCTLLLGLLIVPGAAAKPQQIFQGFEDEIVADPTSAGGTNSAYFSRYEKTSDTDQNVRTGSYSLKLNAGGGTCWVFLNDKLAELTIGKTYQLEFYMKRSESVTGSGEGKLSLQQNFNNTNIWYYDNFTQITMLKESNSTNWAKYSLTFQATTQWCAFRAYSTWELYIDDVTLTEVAPVTVNFKEADGTVIDQRMGLPGSALTLPRTPEKEGYSFAGWYWDDVFTQPVTETVFPAENAVLYAKWSSNTLYYDYEDGADLIANDERKNETLSKTGTAFSITTEKYTSGSHSLQITPGDNSGWMGLTPFQNSVYRLTPGKRYSVSIDVYSTETMNTFRLGAVNDTSNKGFWQLNTINSPYSYTATVTGKAEWQTVTGEFVAKENTNALQLYWSCWNLKELRKPFYIDNLKITPITAQTDLEKAVSAELDYKGSSLRPATGTAVPGNNGQAAIRFKSTISNELIANGITVDNVHYSVVEYGHTYFREDLMGGNTVLDIGTAYNNKKAKNAVAYRKENGAVTTDIWFSKDETNVTYTAALYGFTEQSYTLTYVARPYVKLVADDSTDEITVYGANTQFAAFNDVADRAFYAHPGDVYGREAAYTDVNGDSWSEKYEIRKALYDTVLSKLSGKGFNYLAPAAAAE